MSRTQQIGLIVAVWLGCAGTAICGSSGVQGILDAAGGSATSGGITLVSGSLGQPFETGNRVSGPYRLTAGFLGGIFPPPLELVGDFNGDHRVDFSDFLLFARGYGKSKGEVGYEARFDLNGDGTVGFQDFVLFARMYGKKG